MDWMLIESFGVTLTRSMGWLCVVRLDVGRTLVWLLTDPMLVCCWSDIGLDVD